MKKKFLLHTIIPLAFCLPLNAPAQNVSVTPGRISVDGAGVDVNVQGGGNPGVIVNTQPGTGTAAQPNNPNRIKGTRAEVRGGNGVTVITSDGGQAQTTVGQQVISSGKARNGGYSASSNGDIVNKDLNGQNLAGRDFSRRQITNVSFDSSNLQSANFTGSSLTNVDLSNTDLRGANLQGASFVNVDFDNALLDNAMWSDGRVCGARSTGKCR